MILFEISLFSFEDVKHYKIIEHHTNYKIYRLQGLINCKRQPNWKLIDLCQGNLHCVICNASIAIQIRNDSTFTFNIGNYKRHYAVEHGLINKPEEDEPGDVSESHEEDSPVDDAEQDHSLDTFFNVTNGNYCPVTLRHFF